MIEVRCTAKSDPMRFEVVIGHGSDRTRHTVTMSQQAYERWTAGEHEPEQCIKASFRFLLEREPKEAILSSFDLSVISQYFPEFERALPRYLRT